MYVILLLYGIILLNYYVSLYYYKDHILHAHYSILVLFMYFKVLCLIKAHLLKNTNTDDSLILFLANRPPEGAHKMFTVISQKFTTIFKTISNIKDLAQIARFL